MNRRVDKKRSGGDYSGRDVGRRIRYEVSDFFSLGQEEGMTLEELRQALAQDSGLMLFLRTLGGQPGVHW